MSIPTKAEKYAELMEHLRKAEEAAAMLAHLVRDESPGNSKGWLIIADLFKATQLKVIALATKVMH